MNVTLLIQQLHQLVEEYNNRSISMADYRLERRRLLVDIDAKINGVMAPAESSANHCQKTSLNNLVWS